MYELTDEQSTVNASSHGPQHIQTAEVKHFSSIKIIGSSIRQSNSVKNLELELNYIQHLKHDIEVSFMKSTA